MEEIYNLWSKRELLPLFLFIIKWSLLGLLIGAFTGSSSAIFLISLDWVTNWRESHNWIMYFLPLGGLIVGFLYHYLGKGVEAGNNLIIQEVQDPKKIIPFKMAPLVLLGTLITHLFGGSAGREGTAVQVGSSIADQLNKVINLSPLDRTIILICGISGGFASVFGTPLAGAVFGLEVIMIGRASYIGIVPSFITALVANYVCDLWNVKHTNYHFDFIPEFNLFHLFNIIAAGIVFGITAMVFGKLTKSISLIFKSKIKYPPLRPFTGGVIVALLVVILGTARYIGLGIPVIVESFHHQLPLYDFLFKVLFTVITLGSGFKGGEVTPLFFIGATLGSALSLIIPLPTELLAGLGFVSVFAAAANTPIASILMAIEIFGADIGILAGMSCVVAYILSGHTGIYENQIISETKHPLFLKESGKKLSDIFHTKDLKDKSPKA